MLNQNIKRRRLNLGMTLQEVGEIVGVTRATIQRYESGDIENIDTKMIMKLAKCLKTTPVDLMGWVNPPTTGNLKLDELITICYTMDDTQIQHVIDTVNTYKKIWDAAN